MDQARYCMRSKSNNPHILAPVAAMNNGYGDSWEEQAFAEDTARTVGGCVWPPRSYPCTFCAREFRSAQALGGHMNVHRRDRARMKQSPIPDLQTDQVPVAQTQVSERCLSFDPPPYSSQMCIFLHNNPNPKLSDDSESWVSPSLNVTRVSSSPDTKSSHKEKRLIVTTLESRAMKEDCVTEDLSTSLSLVVCLQNASREDEVGICKRRRINEKKPLSFSPKLDVVDHRCLPQSEGLKQCFDSTVEVKQLDLELRLGSAPKVK